MNDQENGPDLADPNALVGEVQQALAEGRAPRGRRALKDAAHQLRSGGRTEEAARALRTLAALELRHGKWDAALTPAKSALRLAGDSVEADACLDVLAQAHAAAENYKDAESAAEEWLRRAEAREDGAAAAAALLRLASVLALAGDVAEAIAVAEEAVDAAGMDAEAAHRGERVLCGLLLQVGCPSLASRMLTNLLKKGLSQEENARALLLRGWCAFSLGDSSSAARDFRRARRFTRDLTDARLDLVARGAVAFIDALIARTAENEVRQERALASSQRVLTQTERLRDPSVVTIGASLHKLANGEKISAAQDREAAASALVALSRASESITLNKASIEEVRRLAELPSGSPAYSYAPPFPLLPD